MTPDVLNGKELAARLGLSESAFLAHKRKGAFRHLEVKRPVGRRRYSRILLERYLAGESTVSFHRRQQS